MQTSVDRVPSRVLILLTVIGLLLPLGFLALARAHLPYTAAIVGGAVLAMTIAGVLRTAIPAPPTGRNPILLLLLWLGLFAWLVGVNDAHHGIFGQDVLLLPGIAQALPDQPWLPDAFTASEPGRAYPPGLVVLFSPLTWILAGTAQLRVWALGTQAALAALPVLWALALQRWFRVPLGPLPLAALLAASMLCLERTAVLGGAIKNVQHVALGVVLPAVLLLLPRRPGWRSALLSVLLLAALAVTYYTALHLLVAIIAGWALTDVLVHRRVSTRTLRTVSTLAAATVLIAVALGAVVASSFGDDPRLPGDGPEIVPALSRIFIDPRERFWFIFGRPEVLAVGLRRPALGISLLVCLGLAVLARYLPRSNSRLRVRLLEVARLSTGMAIACLALAGMATLAPVTRLSFDYARWLAWIPQLVLLASPFASMALVLHALGAARPIVWVAAVAAILALGGAAHWEDVRRIRHRAELRAVSFDSVDRLASQIGPSAPCLVVAPSNPVVQGMLHVGAHPLSDVVDVVSPCRSAGGSFLRAPLPGARDVGGLPTGERLREWLGDHTVWVIGRAPLVRALNGIRWRRVDVYSDAGGVALWQAQPPSGG